MRCIQQDDRGHAIVTNYGHAINNNNNNNNNINKDNDDNYHDDDDVHSHLYRAGFK